MYQKQIVECSGNVKSLKNDQNYKPLEKEDEINITLFIK